MDGHDLLGGQVDHRGAYLLHGLHDRRPPQALGRRLCPYHETKKDDAPGSHDFLRTRPGGPRIAYRCAARQTMAPSFQSRPCAPTIAPGRRPCRIRCATPGRRGSSAGGGVRVDLAVREVVRPKSIHEALTLLAERAESAPIAGGTDLVVQLRDGRRRLTTLIDLGALRLAGIRVSNGGIEIGAGTRMDAIAADPHVRRLHPALAASAGQVGAWPIQCRATLGGNLANASPAADTAPALIVAAATLVIVSTGGTRRLAVEEFFVGPGRSALTRGELIVAVELPSPAAARGARVVERFVKVGPRREQIVSVVSLAGRAVVQADGTLAEVRLALGSVAPTPVRARRAERVVVGCRPTPVVRREAVVALEADIAPIDDVRAPARYRRLAAAVLLDRFLAEAGHA